MPLTIEDLQICEDSIHLVKGPNGNIVILIPTCSAIKYAQGMTLKAKLDAQDAIIAELTTRLAALEAGNLTWQGISAASNNEHTNTEE